MRGRGEFGFRRRHHCCWKERTLPSLSVLMLFYLPPPFLLSGNFSGFCSFFFCCTPPSLRLNAGDVAPKADTFYFHVYSFVTSDRIICRNNREDDGLPRKPRRKPLGSMAAHRSTAADGSESEISGESNVCCSPSRRGTEIESISINGGAEYLFSGPRYYDEISHVLIYCLIRMEYHPGSEYSSCSGL